MADKQDVDVGAICCRMVMKVERGGRGWESVGGRRRRRGRRGCIVVVCLFVCSCG